MKILYLYVEAMGYTIASIDALISRGAEVHLVHWQSERLTSYAIPDKEGLFKYPKDQFNRKTLSEFALDLDPAITVTSGWQDKMYLSVARDLKKNKKIVVSGFDGQWTGNFKQHIAAGLGKFDVFKRFFSHAWVAGACQFEYARKLGFDRTDIIFDLYSADTLEFNRAYEESRLKKLHSYPHRFLFVGRLELVKGIDILLEAWGILSDQVVHDWELYMVGSGALEKNLESRTDITVKSFIQPTELAQEVSEAGCFVLPSRGEPWGVVVHEAASAGLPIITSNVVGSATSFVIDGFNGFIFQSEDASSLAKKMLSIIQASDKDLLDMGEKSGHLAGRITPETSASNLLSILR